MARWYDHPIWWLISGVMLARLFTPKASAMFKCRVCRIELPDYENYGFNNGAGWQDGFCKRCMLAVSDGRVNLIA